MGDAEAPLETPLLAAQALLLSERGRDLLVINPGSAYLRVGRASDAAPIEVPHVVAYPLRGEAARAGAAAALAAASAPPAHAAPDEEREALCRQLEEALGLPPPPPRAPELASDSYDEPPDAAPAAWTDPGPEDAQTGSYSCAPLFGAAVLSLPPHAAPRFRHVWPMRGGRLAVRADQPLSVVRDALEAHWRWALTQQLGVSAAALRDCSAVLVVPISLSAREVREMAAVLLVRLGIRSLSIHSESSAAAFAAGAPLVCVVNLGAHTAAVACCEEGAEVAGSRLVLPLGGDDVAFALPWLARRSSALSWPLPRCDGDTSAADAALLAELARRRCRVPSAAEPPERAPKGLRLLSARHAPFGAPPRRFVFATGTAACLAPCGLFQPRLLGAARRAVQARSARVAPGAGGAEPDDPLEEAAAAAEAAPPDGAADNLGLDAAVVASVTAAAGGRADVRARLLAHILLAGGGAALRGLAPALAERCAARLPSADPGAPPTPIAAVVARPDPRLCAWRGGALLGTVDSAREGWVRREAMAEGVAAGRTGRYDAAAALHAQLAQFTTTV